MEIPATIEQKQHRFADALVSEEDRMMAVMIRDFVDKEIMPIRQKIDTDARQDFELIKQFHKKMVSLDAQKANIPGQYGGLGVVPMVGLCLQSEEFARGDAALTVAIGVGSWCFLPATLAGNKAVLDEFAPKLCGDEPYICCFAMTEPSGGCNIENLDMQGRGIATRARIDGDEWVINGTKMWCTNSGMADHYTVVCNTDPELGDDGIALIHVPYPIKGLTFGRFEDKAGFKATRECEFYFDDVRVPKAWRVAGPGKDAELFHNNLVYGRVVSAAIAVGCAQGAFEEVLAFTKDRLAAGKPIRQHSIAANMLADMAVGIQVGRDAYINVAYMCDHPETYGPTWSTFMLSRGSISKVFCCDMGVMVTNRAMELMGAYGYVTDHHVEKYWRDVKMVQLWEGGAQLGRLDVVRGYYDYNQFHPNALYEKLQAR